MPIKPHPLIFMVKPPLDVAQAIDDLRAELGAPTRYSVDRLHITLLLVGDTATRNPDDIACMIKLASAFASKAFRVSFDMVGGRVLLGSDVMRGAVDFQKGLAEALSPYAIASRSAFRPHISLHYDDEPQFNCAIDAISWRVDEFLLVESVPEERRHETLARFPLIA